MDIAIGLALKTTNAVVAQLGAAPTTPGGQPGAPFARFYAHVTPQGAAGTLVLLDTAVVDPQQAPALVDPLRKFIKDVAQGDLKEVDVFERIAPPAAAQAAPPAAYRMGKPIQTPGTQRLVLLEDMGRDPQPNDTPTAVTDVFNGENGRIVAFFLALDPRIQSETVARNIFNWLMNNAQVKPGPQSAAEILPARFVGRAVPGDAAPKTT